MQNVSLAAVDNGMAGIVPALAANNHVRLGSQDVDDFALTFIAPLRANQNCVCHFGLQIRAKNFPDASGKTQSGLAHE